MKRDEKKRAEHAGLRWRPQKTRRGGEGRKQNEESRGEGRKT